MQVALRHRDDPGGVGNAAFLRILRPDAAGRFPGGLLIVNAIAEPLELVHVRMRVPASSLCDTRLTDAAAAILIAKLLQRCELRPAVLLFAETDVRGLVFTERLQLDVPVVALPCHEEPPALSFHTPSESAVSIADALPPGAGRGANNAVDATPSATAVLARLNELTLLCDTWRRLGEVLRLPMANGLDVE